MLKKLISLFKTSIEVTGKPYRMLDSCITLTQRQYNMIIAVVAGCGNMPKHLKQYYADLLMLTLLERGEI
jgi:hypothetical protein